MLTSSPQVGRFDIWRRQTATETTAQRPTTESQPSRIPCSAYGVLVGERMRLYAGGGLVAVMMTGKNIHNAVVDIQVSQKRLILPLPLSPSRYPTTFFSLSLSFTLAALTMIPQSSSSSFHIPVLFTPRFLFASLEALFDYMYLQDNLSSTFSLSLHPAFDTNSSPTSHYLPCPS